MQKLEPPPASQPQNFGAAIDVSEDVAVIGASAGGGSAYVFRFDGTQWNQEQQLGKTSPSNFENLGFAVGINGTDAIVGAPRAGLNMYGEAYAFPVTPLVLLVSDRTPAGGTTVTFDACKGDPGGPVALWITSIGGSPSFSRLLGGTFGAGGSWSVSAAVPLGLSGASLTLTAYGQSSNGAMEASECSGVSVSASTTGGASLAGALNRLQPRACPRHETATHRAVCTSTETGAPRSPCRAWVAGW